MLGLIGPRDAEVALLFDGHMDVVPVTGSWRSDPFGGEIRDGRLHGRGSTDMKGGIAAAIAAAALGPETPRGRVGQRAGRDHRRPCAGLGARRLRAAGVVICEPSKLQIKAGQKGRVELLLTFHGKPAHAATPHVGVNPLHAAAKALTVLETLPLPHDDVLGQALLVPTDIVSDPYPSISMIPGAVTIRFDRRTVSGERLEDVLAQIRGHLAGHGLSDSPWR